MILDFRLQEQTIQNLKSEIVNRMRSKKAMSEYIREELLAQMEAMQRQMEALKRQLQDKTENDPTPLATIEPWISGQRHVYAGGDLRENIILSGDDIAYYGSVESLNIQSVVFQDAFTNDHIEPRHLLWTYLNQIVVDTGALDLAGIDRKTVGEQTRAHLELAAVYTALDTMRPAEMSRQKLERRGHRDYMEMAEHERQSVLAFVNRARYAALLGDPGSGKTTFANFLALSLAGEILGLENANLTQLGDAWTQGALLPVRVVLRNFAVQLNAQTPQHGGDTLWDHITRNMGQSLSGFAPLLKQHLLEDGGLLILDGLDEVPEAQQRRELVKQAVLDFRRQFPRVRILLTSRTYAYQRQQWRQPGFEEAVLAPFRTEQIESFINKWYIHLAQVGGGLTNDEAQGRAVILKRAVKNNPHLRELASRPLLLTLMASLHSWRGGSLPDDREQLYEESVELLLDIWERPKIVHGRDGKPVLQTESMAEWLSAPQSQLRKALQALAFEVHAGQEEPTGAADIEERQLVSALLWASNDLDARPARAVEYIRDRAGLLTNKGEGVYSFPHRVFQEYLAARHLTETKFPGLLVQLVRSDAERWREVLLLAGAKVARGTPYAAWTLVAKLCPRRCSPERAARATDGDWWAALLAAQVVVETEIYSALNEIVDLDDVETLSCVRSWLQELTSTGQLSAADRALAGRLLGVLGDERAGVGLHEEVPALAWTPVKSGPFIMGSDRSEDKYAGENESPRFVCQLVQAPYRISRYPITVIQYRTFVAAGGYLQPQYWTEAGWEWRSQNQIVVPKSYAAIFETPNHPQVGVSWYEAVAFCHWLSEQLGYPVRLPTEAEWERAARHTDGRLYPWGNEFDLRRCNMGETDIGGTAAVGLFPLGDAACGAADMVGNVWEWCSTKWLPDYVDYECKVDNDLASIERRVLRGGAFYSNAQLLRCTTRNSYAAPGNRYSSIGFRVVATE
jgi:formylglycine-generating enzyme required for sulfatase activity